MRIIFFFCKIITINLLGVITIFANYSEKVVKFTQTFHSEEGGMTKIFKSPNYTQRVTKILFVC